MLAKYKAIQFAQPITLSDLLPPTKPDLTKLANHFKLEDCEIRYLKVVLPDLGYKLPMQTYDVIVLDYVLDQLDKADIPSAIVNLVGLLSEDGNLFIHDTCHEQKYTVAHPQRGFERVRHKFAILHSLNNLQATEDLTIKSANLIETHNSKTDIVFGLENMFVVGKA